MFHLIVVIFLLNIFSLLLLNSVLKANMAALYKKLLNYVNFTLHLIFLFNFIFILFVSIYFNLLINFCNISLIHTQNGRIHCCVFLFGFECFFVCCCCFFCLKCHRVRCLDQCLNLLKQRTESSQSLRWNGTEDSAVGCVVVCVLWMF